jgi:hypothetical protein
MFAARVLHNGSPDGAVTRLTVALKQSLHGNLTHMSARLGFQRALFPVFVHESRFAANERLVYFHGAAQFIEAARLHRQPDTVIQEPRGLLRHTDSAVQLV